LTNGSVYYMMMLFVTKVSGVDASKVAADMKGKMEERTTV